MTTVDNRIVHMTFDNAEFERNIAQTMASMEKMKASLDFSKAKDSFAEISRGASSINLSGIASAVDGIAGKFTAMGAVAFSVIENITSRFVNAGISMAKSFTVSPILDGFHEMETNMNSIQTILANTDSKGTTLDQVNAALDQLNTYSDQTIYNFSQMARNIGTFTAAGVDLDTSVNSIKGIANLAAISGSNAEQASTAMYQLSQALASGTVKLMDWNSIVNAGMGGEVFQKALFETGKAVGTLQDVPLDQTFDDWKKAGNSFRGSLESGWLTADVLTNTLQSFTGDLDLAQLKALGYTDEQAAEMQRLGKLGKAAATEVKTLTQLLGTVKESVGSGWTKTFQIVFGDFNEAKSLFTDLNNVIGNFVSNQAKKRNDLLQAWKDLGGRDQLILGLKQAFEGLGTIIKPIMEAFRDIFPPITGQRLFELTNQFRLFTAKIAISGKTAGQIREIFRGVFDVVRIGIEIVKQIAVSFHSLFNELAGGSSGGILDFFVNLSGKVQDLKTYLVDDGGIAAFFQKITGYIKDPMQAIDDLRAYFQSLFQGIDFGSLDGLVEAFTRVKDKIKEVLSNLGILDTLTSVFQGIKDAISGIFDNLGIDVPPGLTKFFEAFSQNVDDNTTNSLSGGFQRLSDRLSTFWDILKKVWDLLMEIGHAIGWVYDQFKNFVGFIGDAFSAIFDFAKNIGPNLQKAFMSDEFDQFLDFLTAVGVLLGGGGLAKISKDGLGIDLTGGALPKLGELFKDLSSTIPAMKKNIEGLTGVFSAMQTEIKANALMKIAIAIGILTASVLVLSLIDSDALAKSLSAMAIGFGQLVGAMALLGQMNSGAKGSADLAVLAGGMILMASAVLVLSGSVALLAQLSWEDLGKGLSAVTALLLIMIGTAKLMEGSTASLVGAGVGMIGIATALVILGGALQIFATMSWKEIGKGMAVVAASLLVIAGALQLMPASTILIGPGLVAVALALNLLGTALLIFATMSWEEIGKGMTVLLGSLLILSAALDSMGPTVLLVGPGLIAVGFALNLLALALKQMAEMSMKEIGKSLLVLAGSLLILSVAMNAMSGGLAGAIALGVMAGSLMLLAKVLQEFAGIPFKQLGKGLLAIVAVLAVLGLTALALQPAIGALLLLGIALTALGVAFVLFGVGASLVAEAFQIIAAAGTAGIDVLMYALDQLLQRLPEMATQFAQSIILFAQMILDAAPALIAGIGKVLGALLDQIILLIPKVRDAAIAYIQAFLQVVRESSPDIIKTGFQLITDFLHGIEDNIGDITETVINIILKFTKALAGRAPELVTAGKELLVAFLSGISNNIQDVVTAGIDILEQLLIGIAENIDDIAGAVGDIIEEFITQVGKLYTRIATAGANAFTQFLEGMGKDAQEIVRNAARIMGDFIDAIVESAIILANRMADALIALLDGLSEAIKTHDDEVSAAAYNLLWAIVQGIVTAIGLKAIKDALWSVGKKIGNEIKNAAEHALGIKSPSKVFMEIASHIPEGIVKGLDGDTTAAAASADLASRTSDAFKNALAKTNTQIETMKEFNPTITPVLDLTNVKSTAGQLNGLLNDNNTIGAQVSLDQAKLISTNTNPTNEDTTVEPKVVVPKEVKFEQNIYSPTQLNAAAIYRASRNQIELAKKELAIP